MIDLHTHFYIYFSFDRLLGDKKGYLECCMLRLSYAKETSVDEANKPNWNVKHTRLGLQEHAIFS